MKFVYHGSKEHGLKHIEPRKSTHGKFVYATPEKVLALVFSKRCGDDLTYEIGRTDKNGPWELVENIPGAFEKMYSNTSSIYYLPAETFKNAHTGFEEVISEVGVDVIDEEYYENVYKGLLQAEKDGLLKIYRYPSKPAYYRSDGSDLLDKWRSYYYNLKIDFRKEDFDRFVYLHPRLLTQINALAQEFNYDYHYELNDIVGIFKDRTRRQISDKQSEQYIDCSYISICSAYPKLKQQIDVIYDEYKESIK